MKRYGYLHEKIYDIDNIRLAHKNASKGKRKYTEVKAVEAELEAKLTGIHLMLKNKTFKNSEYEVFTKNDKGKEREIYKLPYYPDRIVHHAIMQILEPIWKKTLIADTFQSIRGRGVHKAKRKIVRALRNDSKLDYYLQVDVRKFYPSISNGILEQIIAKKIKCPDTLWLLGEIINSTNGVPIGNYMSQYFGNLYLGELDKRMKALGVRNYYRYCDDIVMLASTQDELKEALRLMLSALDPLRLTLKPSWKLREVDNHGIDFLGFVFYKHKTLLRKKIVKSYKLSIKIGNTHSIASYFGWIVACDSYNLHKQIKKG